MRQELLTEDQLPDVLKEVLEYWRGLGGEDLRCDWSGFDLMAIPESLLASTMVIDIGSEMEENRYRYWGSQMTRIHGHDMTGLSPYNVNPKELAQTLYKDHSRTLENPRWYANAYEFIRASGAEHRHCSLGLPLSEDGKTVSQIIVVVDLTQADPRDKKGLLSGFPS